ncbi:MAG TPA: bacillithiol biosynthesis cysteine-adding enzyme BshC [Myxococcales bacterium]|nr:bacillithiol biosynthesis cysteine-adding enzyme BshC [Myxococcales bacterium]
MKVPFAPPFLASEPRATALLPDGFRRREAWRDEVRARREQRVRPEVLSALAEQQSALPASEARARNLDLLSQPGTVAVVTGQQVGLFLGPLYTFYKAATAVVWARALEAETGARTVPVFWLQTEDHDFAEIASCHVPPALHLSLPDAGERSSVAHRTLTKDVEPLLAALSDALASQPFAAEILEPLRAAYVPGRPIAQAFAMLLGAVFAEEGLVFLDPRCPEMARAASPLYTAAIERAGEIDDALIARGAALDAAGLREQVNVRRDSPLVFFHGDAPDGPRRRLQQDGAKFQVDGGGEVARADVLQAARHSPLRFSCSALLRPLFQDALLPAVGYVGGPAELGYLAQVAPLYPLLGIRPALAVPRARFRLVDARTDGLLRALALSPAEAEVPRDELIGRLGRRGHEAPDELARRLLGGLPDALSAAAKKHPSLARAARRTQVSVETAVARFAERHAHALAEEDRTLVDRLDRLQASLFPGGVPQERVHSLPFYAAHFGLARLKAAVLGAIQPGEASVKDLRP